MLQTRARITELMDDASSGDDGAFGRFASAVQDCLYRFALAQGMNSPDAAEVVQETLLRAHRRRGDWQSGRDATAWLYGIAMNVVREFRRRLFRIRSRENRLDPSALDNSFAAESDTDGVRAERLRKLAAATAALPRRQREAIACRFLRQMSVRETAEAMGCAEGTVKAATFAALENLKSTLMRIT